MAIFSGEEYFGNVGTMYGVLTQQDVSSLKSDISKGILGDFTAGDAAAGEETPGHAEEPQTPREVQSGPSIQLKRATGGGPGPSRAMKPPAACKSRKQAGSGGGAEGGTSGEGGRSEVEDQVLYPPVSLLREVDRWERQQEVVEMMEKSGARV